MILPGVSENLQTPSIKETNSTPVANNNVGPSYHSRLQQLDPAVSPLSAGFKAKFDMDGDLSNVGYNGGRFSFGGAGGNLSNVTVGSVDSMPDG